MDEYLDSLPGRLECKIRVTHSLPEKVLWIEMRRVIIYLINEVRKLRAELHERTP